MAGKPAEWSCDGDVVLRKLCAASCLDTTTAVIADKEVTFHAEGIDGLSPDWESDAGANVVANTTGEHCATLCDPVGCTTSAAASAQS